MLPGAQGLVNSLICGAVFLCHASFALAGRVCCLQEETFSRNSAEIHTAVPLVDKKRGGAVVLKVKEWSNQVSAPSAAQQKPRELGWPEDQLME